jgi:hypothetical protein
MKKTLDLLLKAQYQSFKDIELTKKLFPSSPLIELLESEKKSLDIFVSHRRYIQAYLDS